jgi:hypothetical protein
MFPATSSVKLGPFFRRVIASGGAKAFAVTDAVKQYQRLGDAALQAASPDDDAEQTHSGPSYHNQNVVLF